MTCLLFEKNEYGKKIKETTDASNDARSVRKAFQ